MPFPQSVKDEGWKRSGGICECRRQRCPHQDRFPQRMYPNSAARCDREATEAHHITAEARGGSNGLSNLEYLCDECHENTQSYGRS